MMPFDKKVLKLLNDYKLILRKHTDRHAWGAKVQELGLKRKNLRFDDEVALYHKANRVVEDIMRWTDNSNNTASWYSGVDEFCQYLRNLLAEYQVENNKIVHTSQQASRAIVEAIQLLKLPNARFNSTVANKLDQCGQVIARFGTREQQEIFAKALKNSQHSDINFFSPLLHNFEKYIQDFAAMFAVQQLDSEA